MTRILSRHSLRRQLRTRRRRLDSVAQQRAARAVLARLLKSPTFLQSRHLACYWPADGELDPRPIMQLAWRMGKQVYLPCLRPRPSCRLEFVRYDPGAPLRRNRLGIPEPGGTGARRCALAELDIVFLPLVGFDRAGHRLGMGGGFYDRTLAHMSRSRRPVRPRLWALAHACQEAPNLPAAHWDVPVQAVITDREWIVGAGFNRPPRGGAAGAQSSSS